MRVPSTTYRCDTNGCAAAIAIAPAEIDLPTAPDRDKATRIWPEPCPPPQAAPFCFEGTLRDDVLNEHVTLRECGWGWDTAKTMTLGPEGRLSRPRSYRCPEHGTATSHGPLGFILASHPGAILTP